MKIIPIIVAAVIAMAGCSTYSSIKERAPAVAFQTDKAADEYIACLHPKFMEFWPDTTLVNEGDSRVLAAVIGTVVASVTVRPAGTGSAVEYRQMNGLTIGNFGKARESIQACK